MGEQAQPASGVLCAPGLEPRRRTDRVFSGLGIGLEVRGDAVGVEVDVAAEGEIEAGHAGAGLDDAVVRARSELEGGHVFFGGDEDVNRVGLALAQGAVKLVAGAGVVPVGGFVCVGEVVDGDGPGGAAGS